MAFIWKQNQAFRRVWYLGQTGLTPALTISKNGANFADPAGGASPAHEIANGFYDYDFAAADADTIGNLAYYFGAGINTPDQLDQIGYLDPTGSANVGIVALPTVAPGVSGGLGVLNTANRMPSEVLGWLGAAAPALVGGILQAFAADLSTGVLAKFFTQNSGQTYGSSVTGSVVKEIAANSGGGGGDPLNHAVPGGYGPGTAGYILGTNLDASVRALAFYVAKLGR